MAVPKKRQSKRRSALRRTHYKAEAPAVHACPQCGDPVQQHRVCAVCGYYRKKQRIEPAAV